MSEQSERLTPGSDGHHFEDSPLVHQRSVRVVRRDELSDDTEQTSGLLRRVAFDSRNPDAQVLSQRRPGIATSRLRLTATHHDTFHPQPHATPSVAKDPRIPWRAGLLTIIHPISPATRSPPQPLTACRQPEINLLWTG